MSFLKKKWFKYLMAGLLLGIVFFLLLHLYSPNWEHKQDFLYFSGALLFAIGWFIYVSNEGLFDITVYGVKQFFKGIFGKRMEKSFIEYREEKEKVDKTVFLMFWLAGLIFVLIGLIVHLV